MAKRPTVTDIYMNEPINYGGAVVPRYVAYEDMQDRGFSEREIGPYMMGIKKLRAGTPFDATSLSAYRKWIGETNSASANPDLGIRFVLGILDRAGQRVSETQSVLFDKAKWTIAKAKKWLKDHGFKISAVDKGGAKAEYYRFRQTPTRKYHTLRTIIPGENPSADASATPNPVLASDGIADVVDYNYDSRTNKTHVRISTRRFTDWYWISGKLSPKRALQELRPTIERHLLQFENPLLEGVATGIGVGLGLEGARRVAKGRGNPIGRPSKHKWAAISSDLALEWEKGWHDAVRDYIRYGRIEKRVISEYKKMLKSTESDYERAYFDGFLDGYSYYKYKQHNPSSAEQLSTDFHGREPEEILDIIEEEQYRGDLAKLGDLKELEILDRPGRYVIPIQFDDSGEPVEVASTPDGKQLLLLGGNQELDLDQLEVHPKEQKKDLVEIGPIVSITYFTDKHHLQGPQYQKKGCDYWHTFGEEGGSRPNLVYDKLNSRMLVVGGSYEVKGEGIVD